MPQTTRSTHRAACRDWQVVFAQNRTGCPGRWMHGRVGEGNNGRIHVKSQQLLTCKKIGSMQPDLNCQQNLEILILAYIL